MRFKDFTVEPTLGRHGEPPAHFTAAFRQALSSVTTPFTPEQNAEQAAIRKLGITNEQRVITEGTIAFLITFDNDFRIIFRDSGGVVTDYEKGAMAHVGRVDVALVAVSAAFLHSATVQRSLEHMRAYRPDVYIPAHHDATYNGLWRATEPLFQAMKDENPDIITVSKSYRVPVCFNTEYNIQRRKR